MHFNIYMYTKWLPSIKNVAFDIKIYITWSCNFYRTIGRLNTQLLQNCQNIFLSWKSVDTCMYIFSIRHEIMATDLQRKSHHFSESTNREPTFMATQTITPGSIFLKSSFPNIHLSQIVLIAGQTCIKRHKFSYWQSKFLSINCQKRIKSFVYWTIYFTTGRHYIQVVSQ